MIKLGLAEFKKITGLSDSALIWILENNKVACSVDPQDGLQLEIDQIDTKLLVEAMTQQQQAQLIEEQDVLAERFARIIGENMDELFSEAIARFAARTQPRTDTDET